MAFLAYLLVLLLIPTDSGWCLVSGRVFPVLDLLSTSVISQISFSQITFVCWVSLAQWDSRFLFMPLKWSSLEKIRQPQGPKRQDRLEERLNKWKCFSRSRRMCTDYWKLRFVFNWLFVVREKAGLLFSGLYFSVNKAAWFMPGSKKSTGYNAMFLTFSFCFWKRLWNGNHQILCIFSF